jgi:hypothetical protein
LQICANAGRIDIGRQFQKESGMATQTDWRFCHKCNSMFFNGSPQKGVCPAAGAHEASGFTFFLPHDIPETPTAQHNWRFCHKCESMYFDGNPQKGRCAAGGAHEASGFNFTLPHDIPETPTAQHNWRFCQKCESMYFDGNPQKGRCAAGGAHVASGFNFTLPHDLPGTRDFNFNPITFSGGTPVGGNAHVTVRQDGSFTFSGHFHDSGAPDFNDAIVVAVKDSQNIVYTFQHTGHMAGTFSSGSRNDDWRIDSRDDRLLNNWAYIAAGSSGQARSTTSADILNIVNGLVGSMGTVLGVVGIVVAL